MNTKSIRFRLTVLYSSVLLLSTVVIFASFFFIAKQELYSNTDTLLRSHGKRVRDLVSKEPELSQNMSSPTLMNEYSDIPGMIFFVTDNQGTPLFMSQPIGNKPISDLFFSFDKTKTETTVTYTIGSIAMRFVLLPLTSNGTLSRVVMMGHPVDVIQKSLNNLYGALLLVFLAFILPSLIGGYILAGRALWPVREITEEMETIRSENLKRRVKNPNTGDEIELLSHAFNSLLSRLEGAFDRERQFMGDVAHELKTPLSTLRGSIELALSKPRTNGDYKTELGSLLSDVDRLSQTLTDLLDLAWSQTDASQNMLELVSLTDMGKELLEIMKKLAYEKHITIQAHVEDGVVVYGKKDKIFRALLNIIENAAKYTGRKGKIIFSVRQRDNDAVVTIRDTGKGIADDDMQHIFDRFYRGAKTDKTLGCGLGLAISHGIILALGGQIHVSSQIGKGTMFQVIFPPPRVT